MSRACLIGVSSLLLIFAIVSAIIVYTSINYSERTIRNLEKNITRELNKTCIVNGVEILREGLSLLYALYFSLYLIFILVLAYFIAEVILYASACK